MTQILMYFVEVLEELKGGTLKDTVKIHKMDNVASYLTEYLPLCLCPNCGRGFTVDSEVLIHMGYDRYGFDPGQSECNTISSPKWWGGLHEAPKGVVLAQQKLPVFPLKQTGPTCSLYAVFNMYAVLNPDMEFSDMLKFMENVSKWVQEFNKNNDYNDVPKITSYSAYNDKFGLKSIDQNDVKKTIDNGKPVLGSIEGTPGHRVVIVGYDGNGNYYVMDSNSSETGSALSGCYHTASPGEFAPGKFATTK